MWAQIASAAAPAVPDDRRQCLWRQWLGCRCRAESLRKSYALQASHPEFAGFRAKFPMMATWDDHDFGLNDAGGSFPMRRWAEELFETFWGSSDAVRSRPGVYDSSITGPEGKRVQVILLDTRFFRSDLKRAPWSKDRPPLGGYLPDDSRDKTILGEDQWAWLEQELAKPADLRIVVSSTQVITDAHQFEGWTNFPTERSRLATRRLRPAHRAGW
jgi:alkaline phosphatase D